MVMKERASERIEFLGADDSDENMLIDLSATGAAFVYHAEEQKDAQISVKIRDFTVDAVVVYCKPRTKGFRIGLRFIDVSADVQTMLNTTVEEFSRGVPLACEIVEREKKSEE